MFASAVAFAPDSTAKPALGRLPCDADGVIIDSIWQKWLLHDPITILQSYKDSLLKLKAIQMYIGNGDDLLPSNGTFHQALLDNGIEHGYEIYSGGHNPIPIMNDLLGFFSDNLVGVVPTISSSSDYYLEYTDALLAETDMDGKLYIVPFTAGNEFDSIYKYQVAIVDVLANERKKIQLSDFEFGKYRVFAESGDGAISNIPAEFCVVPDISPPVLTIDNVDVGQGDSIRVTMSRDGNICLVAPNFWFPDTLRKASDIMNSSGLVESVDALADSEISFSTHDLSPRTYWFYGFDQYGIVSGPVEVEITPVGVLSNIFPEISLYPNPTFTLLTIETVTSDMKNIEITSLNGQLIYSTQMEGNIRQLDLSSFRKGVYFITIRSKDFVTTRKIVKY
jgi:hypothetical protein